MSSMTSSICVGQKPAAWIPAARWCLNVVPSEAAGVPLSHSWSWGWAGPWDCWGHCCRARAACRARGAGRGTGCRLCPPGWWTDTASPAAAEPAGCGTCWGSPGGTAPTWARRNHCNPAFLPSINHCRTFTRNRNSGFSKQVVIFRKLLLLWWFYCCESKYSSWAASLLQ